MESNEANGRLEEVSLPKLLLTLLEERFGGAITLSRDRVGKRFLFHQGAPVSAESNLASESLGVQLMDAGLLDRSSFNRAAAHIERTGAKEGAALLELGLIQPKDLFNALKNQVRIRLLECFGWSRGDFFIDPAASSPEDAQPFRLDVLNVVQDGIEAYWNGERVLSDLAAHMDEYPQIRRGMDVVLPRLRSDDALEAYLEALDGSRSLWKVLQVARSPRAMAAAWVLDAIGAISYRQQPVANGDSAPPEIEIVVAQPAQSSVPLPPAPGSTAQADPSATSRPASQVEKPHAAPAKNGIDELRREIAAATAAAAVQGDEDPEAKPVAPDQSAALETLRAQIAEKHAQLEADASISHYAVLEVPENGEPEVLRRAYLLAAKTYHPDALARLGLDAEVREQASRVFARIGEAHTVLTDLETRRRYDSTRAENATDMDAERLAQAEILYRKAEVLMRQGNFRGALEFLAPAVEVWPEECAYQSALGWVLYKKSPSEAELGREHLENAKKLDPDDGVNLFRLSVVLRDLGDEEGAAKAAARAEQLTA